MKFTIVQFILFITLFGFSTVNAEWIQSSDYREVTQLKAESNKVLYLKTRFDIVFPNRRHHQIPVNSTSNNKRFGWLGVALNLQDGILSDTRDAPTAKSSISCTISANRIPKTPPYVLPAGTRLQIKDITTRVMRDVRFYRFVLAANSPISLWCYTKKKDIITIAQFAELTGGVFDREI